MAVQIQIRRDTAADWISNNPTLAQGEIGLETDTGYVKIGDGSTAWASLAYLHKDFEANLDHDQLTNTHDLTTDIDHDQLTNFVTGEHFLQSAITQVGTVTSGNVDAVVTDASLTAKGKVELATAAETTTGTDATRAVTPDGLAGSNYGKRSVNLVVSGTLATGNGQAFCRIPSWANGWNLVDVEANVGTAPTGAALSIMVRNQTDSVDMLSTAITIDVSEFDSKDATTPPVINATYDDVATGDRIVVDIDQVGSTVAGADLVVELTFQLP